MEGFLAEQRADEARAAAVFRHCDADGDGVLSRAEYTNFLRLAQPDFVPEGELGDEAWAEECANLGAEPRAPLRVLRSRR